MQKIFSKKSRQKKKKITGWADKHVTRLSDGALNTASGGAKYTTSI